MAKKQSTSPTKWTRPEPRHAKLNVDASFFSGVCAGATGAIIRDYKGDFVAAFESFIPNVMMASMSETLALEDGLALAVRLGCNHVQAESGSSEVIDACNHRERW